MKIRRGDLVEFKDVDDRYKRGLIDATNNAWYMPTDCISIKLQGKQSCIMGAECVRKVVTHREELKSWWKWL